MKWESKEGKTLEQILKNLIRIQMSDLVALYNEYSGKKAIKKFSDRAEALQRVREILEPMIKKMRASEAKAKANGSKSAEVPAVSARGWESLIKIREMVKAFDSDSVTAEEIADEVKHPLAAVQKTVNTLVNDGFLISVPDGYSLSELGRTVKAPSSKPAKGKAIAKAKTKPGPRSANAAKVITVTKDGKGYTPHPGSRREGAWNVIKPNMTVAQYREADGIMFDLGVFELKGYITLK